MNNIAKISLLLTILSLSSCVRKSENYSIINKSATRFEIGRKYNYIVQDKKLTTITTTDFSQVDETMLDTQINSFAIDKSDDAILGLNDGQIIQYDPKTKQTKQIDKFFEPIKLLKLSFDDKYIELVSVNNTILLIKRSDRSMSMGSYKEEVIDINFDFDEKKLYIMFKDRVEILDMETKHILKKILLK